VAVPVVVEADAAAAGEGAWAVLIKQVRRENVYVHHAEKPYPISQDNPAVRLSARNAVHP